MNKKLLSNGITMLATVMLTITSVNTGALGGITGYYSGDGIPASPACYHHTAYRTAAEREDSRFIFWSQHQFEYYCPECDDTIWRDEEH